MWPKYPSVELLIRTYSKARVLVATPVDPILQKLGTQRRIKDQDVIDGMVKRYAK